MRQENPHHLQSEADSLGRKPSPVQEARSKIDKSVAYMETQYGQVISREQLAAVAGLNPEHYSRIFRKYKGTSPMDYLADLRMEKAKELLKQGNRSIMEIGQAVGYVDPYHFSRRFKQVVGVSPALFAQQALPGIIALDGLGHCEALGAVPAAADLEQAGGYVRLRRSPQLKDISPAMHPQSLPSKLASLHPAVIITSRTELQQQLSHTSAVIGIDVLQDPIYEQLFQVAQGLGRMQEAADWVRQYEEKSAELRSRLFRAIGGERVAILRVREQLLQIYGMLNMGYPLYRSLQLAPPEKISMQCLCNAYFHSNVIEINELPFYEAEHLFVVVQPDQGAYRQWETIIRCSAWESFPAVRRGNVYQLDVAYWLANDPVSILHQMEEAAALLTGAIRRHNYPSPMQ